MVEHLYPRRPSWTAGGFGRGQQHLTQLRPSRDSTHFLGLAGIAADLVLTVEGGTFLVSGRTQVGMHHQISKISVSAEAEMAPRRQIASQLPLVATERMAAGQYLVQEEQQARGQDEAEQGATGATSSEVRCKREKQGRLRRGHNRWTAIACKGRSRTSSKMKAKISGDAAERTFSSSPSLSWEDMEYSDAGIGRFTGLLTERQGLAQRTSSHQRRLSCQSGCESACSPSADGTATSPSACEKRRLACLPIAGPARAYPAADASGHFSTVVSGEGPYVDAKEEASPAVIRLSAPFFSSSTKGANFVVEGCGGGAEGLAAVVCTSDAPRPLGKLEKLRQRGVSCPCDTGSTFPDRRPPSRQCRSSSLCVGASAAGSGKARTTASLSPVCAPLVSPSLYTSRPFNLSAKLHAGETSLLLRSDRTLERGFGSNSVSQASREAAENLDSGVRSHIGSASEHSPSVLCPFYARGLCPASAAAAAAVRPAVHRGNVHAEIPPARGTPAIASRYVVTASSRRASVTTAECVGKNSADSYAVQDAHVAGEHFECDACLYCMDTCDHISCLQCLPRRSHPDALPPFLCNEEIIKPTSPVSYTCTRTNGSAVDAEQVTSLAGEKSAVFFESLVVTESPHDFACDALPSTKPDESCDRLYSQHDEAGVASRSVAVEQSRSSCSPSRSWIRTTSVPASVLKPDTPKKKDALDSSRPGASWAPCSWFPYRCLRLLAPPARPPVSYSQCQVDRHCRKGGCWLLANGLIYDALPILYAHPGGPECLLRKRGQDCSRDFAFHSKRGQQLWSNFVVGKIKPCRGWTERKQQRKGHQEEGALGQNRDAATSTTAPSVSAQSTSEVVNAAENRPKQRELLQTTLRRTQDHLKQESASEHSSGRGPPSSAEPVEGATFCRIM